MLRYSLPYMEASKENIAHPAIVIYLEANQIVPMGLMRK